MIARFLNIAEVRLLLPPEMRECRAVDAAFTKELVACARAFFTDIFASHGRRTDEDQNAVLAAAPEVLRALLRVWERREV